jgi:pilus assembly protein CpaB
MHNRRGLLFLGIAIVFGVAAVFVAQRWLGNLSPSAPQAPETAQVVVVKADLTVATKLTGRQLGTAEWPKAHLPKGALTGVEQAKGRVLRRPLMEGEPLLESALFPEGSEAGLPGLIAPNRRAVSVKVDPVIGVAGFVKPGTRVDVLVTARRVDRSKAIPYSKVILQDVRVLAVDQKLEQANSGDPELVNVVTLEVEPEKAEALTYASHQGQLQLALRNPTDDEKVETTSVGVADLFGGKKKRRSHAVRSTARIQVLKGSSVQNREF